MCNPGISSLVSNCVYIAEFILLVNVMVIILTLIFAVDLSVFHSPCLSCVIMVLMLCSVYEESNGWYFLFLSLRSSPQVRNKSFPGNFVYCTRELQG